MTEGGWRLYWGKRGNAIHMPWGGGEYIKGWEQFFIGEGIPKWGGGGVEELGRKGGEQTVCGRGERNPLLGGVNRGSPFG